MEVLKEKDFEETRLLRDGDWAVCFGADWCPYCQAFRRHYLEKMDGKEAFSVGWGDLTDLESPLWKTFGIEVVPVLVAFRNGKIVWRKDAPEKVGLHADAVEQVRTAFL